MGERKSRVCYFPLNLPMGRGWPGEVLANPVVHIAWPHRWEHDKDPEAFFRVIFKLLEEGLDFKVSVIGQTYGQLPDVFEEARQKLGDELLLGALKQTRRSSTPPSQVQRGRQYGT